MEKIIIYVAYDGTRFSNEASCREYELAVNTDRFKKDFILYDKDKQPIPHNFGWQNEDVCYILILNPSAELQDYLEYRFYKEYVGIPWRDYDLEFRADCYYLDDFSNWRSWSEEMENLERIGDHFQLFTEN